MSTAPPETPRSQVPPDTEDRVLLEGPHSRSRETFLIYHVVKDFVQGFRTMHFVGPCVTVFGSARVKENHPYYQLGREVGAGLARLGFTVMTGGGPGMMEAANRGARESGGRSVGVNIALPMEQYVNPYLDRSVTCRYFFVRKVILFKYSYAFVALPGGLGTLDELTEALTLIQTRKILHYPVVLFGAAYWRKIVNFDALVEEGMIAPADLRLFEFAETAEEGWASMVRRGLKAHSPNGR